MHYSPLGRRGIFGLHSQGALLLAVVAVVLSVSAASAIEELSPLALSGEHQYDVVVYGGTSGGIVAAIEVAKEGKTVILIEPSKHLGGLTTGALGATDIGN